MENRNRMISFYDIKPATSPPVLSLGELDETASCLILLHWPHYAKTWRHLQNRKYVTLASEEDRDRNVQKISWSLCF